MEGEQGGFDLMGIEVDGGIEGAIVGKALYAQKFTLVDALRIASA